MTDSTKKRLVFFGDSICVGQGVSIHKGWVTRVAAQLSVLIDDAALVITNASVNGNTTRQALERMPYDVQSHGVDLLILQFGMNDCNYWNSDLGHPRVSPDAFKANLAEIIGRAFTFGAQQVLLNTNHPTTRTQASFPGTTVTYQDSNKLYNALIREVASGFNDGRVTLIDVEQSFEKMLSQGNDSLEAYLLDDGLHLSEKGHDVYFNAIFPVIERVAKKIVN